MVAGGGEAGGGEDVFELAGADDGVDLGDVFLDFVAVAFDEAAGDDDLPSAAFGLVRDHLEDGVYGLLLGGVDKGAGVDDDDLGVGGVGGELGAVVVEQAHHDLGVDEVFGAAERDEADLGAGDGGGGVRGLEVERGWGGHSLLVYQGLGAGPGLGWRYGLASWPGISPGYGVLWRARRPGRGELRRRGQGRGG